MKSRRGAGPMGRLFLRTHAMERWIRWRFTPGGRLLLGALVAVGLFSLNPRASSAYELAVVIMAALLASTLWAPWFRPRLRIERATPGFATDARPFTYRMRVHNMGRRPLYGARIREDQSLARYRASLNYSGGYRGFLKALHRAQGFRSIGIPIPDCAPGAFVDVSMPLTPSRRGYVELVGVVVHRCDPLGIFNAFARLAAPDRLLCLPARHPVTCLAVSGVARSVRAGVSPSRVSGNGLDFARLREYRAGDPLRHIDWRAWARIGEPVVKEFHEEAPARSALILDTAVGPQANVGCFEAAVRVAASFAVDSSWRGAQVELLFAGDELLRVARGREQEGVARMLECLACVAPAPSTDFLHTSAMVRRLLNQFSSCVCVLLDLDGEREALLRALASNGCRLWVLWVHAGDETPATAAPALEDAGVRVIPVSVDDVARTLAGLAQQHSPPRGAAAAR